MLARLSGQGRKRFAPHQQLEKHDRGSMHTSVRILLIVVLVLSAGAYSWAGPPTDQVRAYTEDVTTVLQSPTLTLLERRAAIGHIGGEALDVSETAQRALGVHWRQRIPAQREEFVMLFAPLLQQTYISMIDRYGGEPIAGRRPRETSAEPNRSSERQGGDQCSACDSTRQALAVSELPFC